MGIWGMRRVLTTTIAVCAVAITAWRSSSCRSAATWRSARHRPDYPPMQSAVRTIYPKMVTSRQLTPLFSLDASRRRSSGSSARSSSPSSRPRWEPLRACCSRRVPRRRRHLVHPLARGRPGAHPAQQRRFGTVLTSPPVLLVTIVGFLLVGACAAIEAGVVATFGHGGAEAGFVLAILAIGRSPAGLSFGHMPIGPWAMARASRDRRRRDHSRSSRGSSGRSRSRWWSPASAWHRPWPSVLDGLGERQVQRHRRGLRLGRHRPADRRRRGLGHRRLPRRRRRIGRAFWASTAFALLALVVAVVFHRAMPDLRVRDASPIPDTDAVPTQPS